MQTRQQLPAMGHGKDRSAANREKRRVALSSVMAAIALTAIKGIVGVSTGSLGILSEAAHSGLDLCAAGVTLWAIRAASRPADREHPYGHGKIENLAALFETVLLFATCGWIASEAVNRLAGQPVEVRADAWAFGVMMISIVVDISRSRALRRVARKYQSQALEADALHFSTDVWSSLVVLLGLVFVRLADLLELPWLMRADAVAALVVAFIVAWISFRLGRRAVNDLLDAVPPRLRAEVEAAARVPGVLEVRRARVRRCGPESFADLTVTVDREVSLDRAHDIADRAEAAVQEILPGADVVVHVDPARREDEGTIERVRRLAARHGFGAHGILIHDLAGRRSIEMHLEASDTLLLKEASDRARNFRKALRAAFPWLSEVVTHLEPVGDRSAMVPAAEVDEQQVLSALRAIEETADVPFQSHQVEVRRARGRLTVSFHCALEPGTKLVDAHAFTEDLERRLRARVRDLGRIVIQIEALGDDR